MPLYVFQCNNGHETEAAYRVNEKPDSISCERCKKPARSILSPVRLGSCWPEGRVFEHVGDTPRVFKNYKELDAYAQKNGCAVETSTPAQLSVRQEERRHKISKGIDPSKPVRKKKMKVPEKIDKAFRECPTVESAVRALKENRI